jgi:hypothetical protein
VVSVELSTAAKPWTVEVAKSTTCLFLSHAVEAFPAALRAGGAVALTLQSAVVPALTVALDSVLAHPLLADHQVPVGWSALSSSGAVSLTGLATVFFTAPHAAVMLDDVTAGFCRVVEVEHEWLAGLRRAVAPWAGSPPPVVRPLG